jgi:hypothetical protein
MIGVGFQNQLQGSQKQETGLPGDIANVAAIREQGSSLCPRTTGQMFAQRLTVHNSVYNQLLGWGFANQNLITKQNHPSLNARGHRNWIR